MKTIRLDHVSKKYEHLTILNDISISFEAGYFYGIIGPSGAGKTTLLQILGTLDNPTDGEVYLLDKPVHQLSAQRKAVLRNRHVGYVFQSYFLNRNLNATENVMLPMLITEKSYAQCQRRAEQLLASVGLEHRLTHLPTQLSGGEQQRVAIARAMANNPSVILADEPTGNLDADNEAAIMDIFSGLVHNEQKTVIMVTHNRSLLPRVDCLLRLEQGRLYPV